MHHIFVVSGLINSILSWGFFKPLARINYLTYLLHVGVLQLVLYSATYSIEFTDIIAVSVTTLVVYTIKLENKMFPRCIELLLCRLRYDYLRRRLRRSPHGGVAFHRSGKTPSRRWVRQKCSFKKVFAALFAKKPACKPPTSFLAGLRKAPERDAKKPGTYSQQVFKNGSSPSSSSTGASSQKPPRREEDEGDSGVSSAFKDGKVSGEGEKKSHRETLAGLANFR